MNDNKPESTIITGDCREVMAGMDAESVDSVVTDPPYGLKFMGKEWDHGVPGVEFWAEALRVAKPGAHLLAFGGTRMVHRLAVAIEDAGWEIRDRVHWVYGSGFPKSHNLKDDWHGWGTALKPATEPVIVGYRPLTQEQFIAILVEEIRSLICQQLFAGDAGKVFTDTQARSREVALTVPESAKIYELENSVNARFVASRFTNLHQGLSEGTGGSVRSRAKPNGKHRASVQEQTTLLGRVADFSTRLVDTSISEKAGNTSASIVSSWSDISDGLLSHASRFTTSTAIRLTTELRILKSYLHQSITNDTGSFALDMGPAVEPIILARKPFKGTVAANVLEHGTGAINVDGCRVPGDDHAKAWDKPVSTNISAGAYVRPESRHTVDLSAYRPTGRFPANLIHDGSDESTAGMGDASRYFYCPKASKKDRGENNNHPTVKPTELMAYLCRLITPPGGLVLDLFAGSGSTGKAAVREGFRFVGIEKEPEYADIARSRLSDTSQIVEDTP